MMRRAFETVAVDRLDRIGNKHFAGPYCMFDGQKIKSNSVIS